MIINPPEDLVSGFSYNAGSPDSQGVMTRATVSVEKVSIQSGVILNFDGLRRMLRTGNAITRGGWNLPVSASFLQQFVQSCLLRCNSCRPVPVHFLCPCRSANPGLVS